MALNILSSINIWALALVFAIIITLIIIFILMKKVLRKKSAPQEEAKESFKMEDLETNLNAFKIKIPKRQKLGEKPKKKSLKKEKYIHNIDNMDRIQSKINSIR
ncbi:MAG: hypothetical protein OQK82_08210 [Candidatus Pacearchaeota archaeon]|nr:hypothetical protein [Candidatus Pacearchaeota archaeon]